MELTCPAQDGGDSSLETHTCSSKHMVRRTVTVEVSDSRI